MGLSPCSSKPHVLGANTRENAFSISRVFSCKSPANGLSRPHNPYLHRHQPFGISSRRRCLPTESSLQCSQQDSSQSQQGDDVIIPEVLPPHDPPAVSTSDSSAELPQSAKQRERWGLASWVLGSGGRYGTALLAAGGAASAGFLGPALDFSGPQSIASALAVLAAIIAIHEAGHFAAARSQGIHVTKFAIGFGPAVLSYQGKEVEYSLRAIPLGGYVAFPDDDPDSKFAPDDPDLLRNRSIPERALVISAGVLANIVFAYSLLLTQVSTVGVSESQSRPGVLVPEVSRASPAAEAGVRPGDVILKIGAVELPGSVASVQRAVTYILDHPEKRLDLTIARQKEIVHIPVTPVLAADGGGRIGVSLAANARVVRRAAAGPVQALRQAGAEFARLASIVTGGLQQVVFNFDKTKDSLSGPVAIVAVGAEVARSDAAGLYQFAAILNINLAVINILPLPALDGGYLALLLAEAVRGKKLEQKLEQGIMASGFLLITAVGLLLVLRDTLNLTLSTHL